MERRGRIPVAKFRTQESKTRSRSRVREPDYNEQDPETDLFTLLEDNIALKEENKELKLQIEDLKKTRSEAIEEKNRIREQLFTLERQQESSEMQIREFMGKLTKVNNERNALDKLHKMKTEAVSNLEQKLKSLQLGNSTNEISNNSNGTYLQADKSLREKLVKMIPNLSSHSELESLVDLEPTEAIAITNILVERLVDEFFSLKNSFNAVELQLYEANEKIAELIENQHHLEEESEILRTENTNLTKVAKLLTENMKESVETSKKMETALIKLKQRNDDLVAKSRDFIDGQSSGNPSPASTPTMEENIQPTGEPEDVHNERIVEMKTLLEAAIKKTTNDELKTLQLKLEILEAELRKTIERAEVAENELEKYKIREQEEEQKKQKAKITASCQPPPPPPPPPPLPVNLLYKGSSNKPNIAAGDGNLSFSSSIAAHNINNQKDNQKVIENVLHQVQPEAATGLDALVREFKSGRVTLRKNRRQTRTNPALQEMFDVLEISQKQNRNSKICIDLNK